MNTHSSRSHTIVQFTISCTTSETSSAASHISSGGESTGTALGSTPTATYQRRQQHFPRDDDNNKAEGEEYGGEACSDHEPFQCNSGTVSGGRENVVSAAVTTRAKLSLVDLAGSEKGRVGGEGGTERGEPPSQTGSLPTQGEDNREAQERARINSSLSALSNCISCLGEARRTHVPFRDNPLTR